MRVAGCILPDRYGRPTILKLVRSRSFVVHVGNSARRRKLVIWSVWKRLVLARHVCDLLKASGQKSKWVDTHVKILRIVDCVRLYDF